MSREERPVVPLPAGWSDHAQAAVLHAVALARLALMHVRGWCADSPLARVRLAGERDAAVSKVAQLEEEARLLRARMATLVPARRPHYPPPERLAILTLRAATGWTVTETARRFQVSEPTIRSWMTRLDEKGEHALVQRPVPVNRYPELVAHLVQKLCATLPSLGKVRIADMLARAGLHVSASTVGRMRKSKPVLEPPAPERRSSPDPPREESPRPRQVTARYPHDVWNVDLTILPTAGWWVPWFPFALPPVWPYCFWLGVVLDHFTRAVVAHRLFRKEPTAAEICALLDEAKKSAGKTPKHTVTDQGVQFRDTYRAWCEANGVRPRFGAIGQHGSIAVLERFFRSLKDEMLRRLAVVPLSMQKMEAEVVAWLRWYATHRPHQSLHGRTPEEVREAVVPARDRPRFEPRARCLPRGSPERRLRRVDKGLVVDINHLEGRQHLPLVSLREAA